MNLIFHDVDSALAREVTSVVTSAQTQAVVHLQTSGTTGTPRQITKDLAKALRRKRSGNRSDRFMLTFSPTRWAGVSVIVHCYQVECTLIVPASLSPLDIIAACFAHRPTHISLTPSLFRNLVLHDHNRELRSVGFLQITFGGEAAPQSVLDLARALWPKARLTHTYASTEHGDICAVSDGRAGFPPAKFARHCFPDGGKDGELHIDGVPTGDFWRLEGDRYHFVGRREEIINVGGNKVSPAVVEEAAFQCGVKMAKAYAVPSPLLGSLVALDFVGDIPPPELRRQLAEKLPKFACPARLSQLNQLELSEAGKLVRKP